MPEPLIASSVVYYSEHDEAAFFEWLARIPCVANAEGVGRKLFIHLTRQPSDSDLREIVALFIRYKINMRQLARFSTPERAWFRDPDQLWHRRVFGSGKAAA